MFHKNTRVFACNHSLCSTFAPLSASLCFATDPCREDPIKLIGAGHLDLPHNASALEFSCRMFPHGFWSYNYTVKLPLLPENAQDVKYWYQNCQSLNLVIDFNNCLSGFK